MLIFHGFHLTPQARCRLPFYVQYFDANISPISTNYCNDENGEKSPECGRFKLYAQSGPFESGDFANFGENSEFGWQKWRKSARGLAIQIGYKKWPLGVAILAKLGPLESGEKGENGDFGKSQEFGTRAGDIQNVANILIGCHVAP